MDHKEGPQAHAGTPDSEVLDSYWKKNLNLTLTLLSIWFLVGYILAIFLAPWLNTYNFLGGPLGYWVAQNGAIYVFVILIFVYAQRMNSIDEEFNLQE